MGRFKDIAGERYGRLVARKRISKQVGKRKMSYWICDCDCGNKTTVQLTHLTSGDTKSCGCLSAELASKRNSSHRMINTRFYSIWAHIKTRILNENCHCYSDYGGRGLRIDENWLEFEHFYNDMHNSYKEHTKKHCEKNTTIDRINNDKGYFPKNCRWATQKQQVNNRRNTLYFTIKGERMTASQIANKYDLTHSTVSHRINRGWSEGKVISPPRR